MPLSVSSTVVAKHSEDTILGATTIVVTDDDYREPGDRKAEFLIVDAKPKRDIMMKCFFFRLARGSAKMADSGL